MNVYESFGLIRSLHVKNIWEEVLGEVVCALVGVVSRSDSLAEFSPISVTNMFIKSFLGKKGPRKGLRASTQPQGCLLK